MPSEPLILAFDTSAAHCAAALLSGERVLAMRHDAMVSGQAERLMPLLESLLDESGHDWRELGLIGVGIGPGNFTGTRIAVAAARGLALALGIKALGVTGFEALAIASPLPVLASLDARRGDVWLQRLSPDKEDAPFRTAPDGLPARLQESGLSVIGHMAAELAARTGGAVLQPRHDLAVAIGLIALAQRDADLPRPAPLYLRPADAAPSSDSPPVLLP